MTLLTILVSILYYNDTRLVYEYLYVSSRFESLAFAPNLLAIWTMFLLFPIVMYLTTYKWLNMEIQCLTIVNFISVCGSSRCGLPEIVISI